MKWADDHIADIPDYWTDERLREHHSKFISIGTCFGKSANKDPSGNDLYLFGLNVDDELVTKELE